MISLTMHEVVKNIHKEYCQKYVFEDIENIKIVANKKKLKRRKIFEILDDVSKDYLIKELVLQIVLCDDYNEMMNLEKELGRKLIEYQKKDSQFENNYFSIIYKAKNSKKLNGEEKINFFNNYSYSNYQEESAYFKVRKKTSCLIKVFPILVCFEQIILNSYAKFSSKSDKKIKKLEFLKEETFLLKGKTKEIFLFDNLLKDKFRYWSAYLFTYLLDLNVCPYCNSQYIYTYTGKNKNGDAGGIRPELDHCFPKSRHPFLAVSIYNLVPSCSQCNGSIKSDKDVSVETVVNLYTEDITNKFEFYLEGSSLALLGKSSNFRIKYRVTCSDLDEKKRIEAFLDSFHLESRYVFLQKYISEQIALRRNHSTHYLHRLNQKFNLSVTNEIYEEGKNRFLGKLLNDIINL